LQRAIQSCFVHLFDQSTVKGEKKVVVIAYDRRTGAVPDVDEIVGKLFPGELTGYLLLTMVNDGFEASFIYRKSSGEIVILGYCRV